MHPNTDKQIIYQAIYSNKKGFLQICDVTAQNQALVAICHLPQMQFQVILYEKYFI